MKINEFDDYIFALTTERNEKINIELEHEDELEENSMTVHVKTISGKTVSVKCDKKQRADKVSKSRNENADPLEYNLPRSPRKSAERQENNRRKQH